MFVKRNLLFVLLAVAACAPSFVHAQDAQNKFRLAQSFEQEGDYERASRLYEDLARSDSLNYSYFDGLRRCYEQVKNYDGAISLSLRRLKLQPADFGVLVSLGSIYYKAGDEKRADSVWQSTLALMPRNIGVYTIVAAAQSENRLFEKSIATYLQGRRAIGTPTLFSGELAALYSLLLKYDDATREYMAILSMDERQLEFIESRLAGITSKKEGLSAATNVVEAAVERDDHQIVYRRLLLWLTLEAKDFDRALHIAKEIDAAVNSNGVEMLSFAERAYNEKAYRVAAEAFQFSIEKYPRMPQLPEAKFGYAQAIEKLSAAVDSSDTTRSASGLFPSETQAGYRGALGPFLALAQEYPNSEISVNALYQAALLYYRRFSDLNGAERIIDSVIALPTARLLKPKLLGTAAEINVAKGSLDKAVERYTGIISSPIAPAGEKTEAQYRIAEIHYFRGEFDTASSLLMQIAQTLSDDQTNDALLLLHFIKENQSGFADALRDYAHAELLQRENRLSEAIPLLTSIVENNTDAPLADDALMKKAELSIVIKQYSDALASYQKVIVEYPKSILRDKAEFGIADLYQNGLKDKEKAIHAYEDLLMSYPNSLLLEEARKRIRELRGDVL